ncbi:MGMT family protein [Adlercreutzia equolifaciens]|uniref:MGMT family protein n=1 Tax=Adlercreutzia equolifaciens TaxID=446660 RepID=UPI003AEF8884
MGDYANRVFAVVRRIPRGKVATYGQVARLIGAPRTARYVGYALHANPEPGTDPGCIPCHRVVFKDGRMATGFAFGGPDEQRGMLAAEGIAFDEEGRVLMEESQWDGRPESAGAPGNAHVTGDSGAADTADATDYPTAPPPDFDWEAELAEHPLHHCETCAAPRPDCKKERHA